MSFEDFFKKIDAEVSKERAENISAEEAKNQRKEFLKELVSNMAPIAISYGEELVKRGVIVEVNPHPYSIIFSMKKKDTNYKHTLVMGEDNKSNGFITFECHSTNDDGKPYTSTSGSQYSQNNWEDKIFTEKLEKEIEHFFFYSKRHN